MGIEVEGRRDPLARSNRPVGKAEGRRQEVVGSGQWAVGSGQKAVGKEEVDWVRGNDDDPDERDLTPRSPRHPIPRFIMQPREQPLPDIPLTSPTGLFWITEDDLGIAAQVAALIEAKGAKAIVIPKETLQSAESFARMLDELRENSEEIAGILHLAPLSVQSMPETLTDWREFTQAHVKRFLQMLQLWVFEGSKSQSSGEQEGATSKLVLSASLLGGTFGREEDGNAGLATGGASTGLLKTLTMEASGVQAKAVDFDSHLSSDAIAQCIVQELRVPGGNVEVGYPQGKRTIFQTAPAPLSASTTPAEQQPAADWVVLITGGARGITAEIAKTFVIPGMTVILVGRSPEPAAESEITRGVDNIPQLRSILLERAKTRRQSPTPVQIETALQSLLRDRAIRNTLQTLRQRATVEYWPVDVRDAEAFGSLLEQIDTRYGRLDAVIHGAGIIEDKLIADKRLDSFERVFDTKVDSAFILSRHLRPDSLKLLVFFSSVAGRYGNRGQSDYAAANEVVNRLAWQLSRRWPSTRVAAINWGPWDTTGMASESVKRQFREAGIVPIPLEAGCQFFIEELSNGRKGEVEIIAGEGPWSRENSGETFQTPNPSTHPFVLFAQRPQLQPNGTVTLEHTFSLVNDPYLRDHQLDGKPVLPATGAVEWFAEVVQSAWPEWVVTEVRDLRVLRGLVLEGEADRSVLFRAKASTHADSEALQVAVELLDAEGKLPCYRASVRLEPELRKPPLLEISPLNEGTPLEPAAAYRDYLFHGSRFQLIAALDRIAPQGIDARVRSSSPGVWKLPLSTDEVTPSDPRFANSAWLFDPGLLDTAPQLAIVWARVQHNTTALPSRLGAVIRYSSPIAEQLLQVALRVKACDRHSLTYDALFIDADGKVCLQMQNVESTCNPSLNRLASQSHAVEKS
ncbi:MAG: SDR family NAD(P)-dependent oxidoreductase [Cyanobacteriota bacterium]|nr:SDR family NAD(P)-dependent oxidoreductase [Cyanobacteriota bacterium]